MLKSIISQNHLTTVVLNLLNQSLMPRMTVNLMCSLKAIKPEGMNVVVGEVVVVGEAVAVVEAKVRQVTVFSMRHPLWLPPINRIQHRLHLRDEGRINVLLWYCLVGAYVGLPLDIVGSPGGKWLRVVRGQRSPPSWHPLVAGGSASEQARLVKTVKVQ